MKKFLSLVLALTLCCAPLSPVLAAEGPVTPTPPDWLAAEDYLTFPGDQVYLPENWAEILALRADAASGASLPEDQRSFLEDATPGTSYELGLIRFQYAVNSGVGEDFRTAYSAFNSSSSAWKKAHGGKSDERSAWLDLWAQRAYLAYAAPRTTYNREKTAPALARLGLTMDDFFDFPFAGSIPQENRDILIQQVRALDNPVALFLDGTRLEFQGVQPEVFQQRVMIPLRGLAQRLGADVDWRQETGQVVMTRGGSTVVMTLGSTTALVDGTPMEMDVAPYATAGSTLIPARYVSEFFGQSVEWVPRLREVHVTEDKSVAEGSNLEAWALPMGAVLSFRNFGDATRFGLWSRGSILSTSPYSGGNAHPVAQARATLSESWGIENGEDLADTANALSEHGQNCFDFFRVSNLAQWGYTAGYLTYADALALVEPAARRVQGEYASWDEAYESYLEGYYGWSGETVPDGDLWRTVRGGDYLRLKKDEEKGAIFDDTLFQTGVIGLPEA